jgi:mRNA interferase RelE/StbE
LAEGRSASVKRLKGSQNMRLWVGDYRAIFYEMKDSIVVVAVGHRKEVYKL